MARISPAAANAIRRLVDDIVAGDYAAIAADGRIGRLAEDELRLAIAEYGRTPVSLPADAVDAADIYQADNDPREFYVDLYLWTAEEGQSDLTLSLTVVEADDGLVVSIDDLHVL